MEVNLNEIPLVLANRENYGSSRSASSIKYLVFHYTGNDGDRDTNNAKYFRDNVTKSSAHYFVDDDSITQSVPDLYSAYAVGGDKWNDTGKTGGGSMYGVVKNANSISIEMCDTQKDGVLQATEATMERSAALGRALMEKYNIPLSNVYRHFDVTGKHCPAYLMDADKWAKFKERLEEPDEVTKEEVKSIVNEAMKAVQPKVYTSVQECPAWARTTVQAAIDADVLNGDGAGKLHLTDDTLVMLQMLYNLDLFK